VDLEKLMKRRDVIGRLAATLRGAVAISCSVIAWPALSQDAWLPTKPVTLVVPYNPGGGTDATARAVARRLTTIWKQPVIVENVGGADGLLGTRRVIEAKPDGYTLLFQVPSLVLMKYQPSLKGIDPLARLEPVTAVATSPTALVISGTLPFKSLAELVAYCRREVCNAGSGENSSKIRARQFVADYHLKDLAIVNYRGTAPIVTDLVAGNLTMAFTGITAALPFHRTGRLKILVTNGERRALALPDIPTSLESGWPDSYSVTWYGVFAPKGTPTIAVASIASAIKATASDPEVLRAIEIAGAEPAFTTPAQFSQQVRDDDARLSGLAKRFPFE
jgi:tripartite-type tricarboxylate transporter receptor subunit TctC